MNHAKESETRTIFVNLSISLVIGTSQACIQLLSAVIASINAVFEAINLLVLLVSPKYLVGLKWLHQPLHRMYHYSTTEITDSYHSLL